MNALVQNINLFTNLLIITIMKKLLFLAAAVIAFAGCGTDETAVPGSPDGPDATFAPRFYGAAMLDDAAPSTRGVAQSMKVWSKPMAAEHLTVKFLNGTERYREFVKDAAKEWEKAAGVRFQFVDDMDAVIRVGFDYVPGMMSSWALTGTDHMQVYDRQTEPTVHFAQWRRASDNQKRSDVLRAFGQALGLELEFRHPKFHPAWITDQNGNIDEAKIREYWENELAGYISWEELKKVVLDPLADNAFFVTASDNYDRQSVMNWPFYEMIAANIPPIEFDEDYKTELSVGDKEFIRGLYGESFGEIPPRHLLFPLIEFDFTGTSVAIDLATSKNLFVFWDKEAGVGEHFDLPTDTTRLDSVRLAHTYPDAKTRRIVIAEKLEYGQVMPTESRALLKFDFDSGSYAENIDIKPLNKALWYVRIIGGNGFKTRNFNFTGYEGLKELYLVQTLDSRLTVKDCPNLEVVATSRFIHVPPNVKGPFTTTPVGEPVDGVYPGVDGPVAEWDDLVIGKPLPLAKWPDAAEYNHSLSERNGKGITIQNCPELNTISLEHTRITGINFDNLPKLKYIYLSSMPGYIVGGSLLRNNDGEFLCRAFSTLNMRPSSNPGLIVLRGVFTANNIFPRPFVSVSVNINRLNEINTLTSNKNWRVVWDSGCRPFIPIKTLEPME